MGEDQKFTDFKEANQTPRKGTLGNLGPLFEEPTSEPKQFDERYYRPFAVTVSVAIHEIHGHLLKVYYIKCVWVFFMCTQYIFSVLYRGSKEPLCIGLCAFTS